MIKIYPATIAATSPALYAVEMDETVRNGIGASTVPTIAVTVTANGSPVTAGATTMQTFTLVATLTYQPCSKSSETKVKMYSESFTAAVPGAMTTFEPTIGAATVTTTGAGCCGKAYGVKVLTSISVAYSA